MIRLVQVGLGPLGQKVVRFALKRDAFKIVAAVDPAPDKAGADLGRLCGVGQLGIRVRKDLKSALKARKADVALVTTVSSLKRLEPQVAEIARAGLDIVSTCEELSFPWRTAPAISKRLDAICKRHKATCLGTGVNPGFLMDYLPAVMTGVCRNVEKIVVRRIQDASVRRIPFQQKIGAGLTTTEFRRKKDGGTLRHVGLTESVHLIAHAMGWKLDRVTESLRPVMATAAVKTGYVPIKRGMARGVEQVGRGYLGRKQVITLHFRAAVGEPESFDRIEVTGEPNICSVIQGGVNGDIATCAITLNAARSVLAAEPGLKTMLDVPAATFFKK